MDVVEVALVLRARAKERLHGPCLLDIAGQQRGARTAVAILHGPYVMQVPCRVRKAAKIIGLGRTIFITGVAVLR